MDEAAADRRPRGTIWRIDPGRRAAVAMVVLVILTAGLVGARLVFTRPQAEAVPASATVRLSSPAASSSLVSATTRTAVSSPAASLSGGASVATTGVPSSSVSESVSGSGSGSGSAAIGIVVVDVVGRVRRPGLVRLAAGARVDDAIRAAGGARTGTDLSGINLARVCVDGEQIAVGVRGAGGASVPAVSGSAGGSAGTPAAMVNLNTATLEQLDTLPGVGPVMAQRIVDWRTTHGPFGSVDELRQVSGIGDITYARLSPLVTV